ALAIKGFTFDVEHFTQLDARRRAADVESQALQAERKSASKKIGALVSDGVSVDDAKAQVEESLTKISTQLDAVAEEAKTIQSEMEFLLLCTPNLPAEDVPAGDSEADNVEVSRWGEPRAFDFAALDHVDLGEAIGMLDTETAVKITGSRFTVMYGQLAQLQRALTQFMLNLHTSQHGYREIYVPYLVNAQSLRGTGSLPKFEEDLFKLQTDPALYLIPTAEVPVTNVAQDRIFEDAELGEHGIRFVCHSPCFRSEAGSYGKDTRGMIRQHQFEKVELVHLVRPAQSVSALEVLTGHAEQVLQQLELPYRRVLLCGGDLSFSSHKTYDLEVWLPGQSSYREISSCSHFGDYQARRMQARWRNPETGKPELLHTLNGSGLAVGRTLVAVLENYQQADGSIAIPAALQPFMGGADVIGA
ncbi:MAG: serine--tRNA ligase, partial [Pseudomonadota bacterium]